MNRSVIVVKPFSYNLKIYTINSQQKEEMNPNISHLVKGGNELVVLTLKTVQFAMCSPV